jgi:hypothetical protein
MILGVRIREDGVILLLLLLRIAGRQIIQIKLIVRELIQVVIGIILQAMVGVWKEGVGIMIIIRVAAKIQVVVFGKFLTGSNVK